jgi:glycosyltransferase involved in cell wall biosynthesis
MNGNRYPPDITWGIGAVTAELAHGLKKMGHNPVVIAESAQAPSYHYIENEIPVYRVRPRILPNEANKVRRLAHPLSYAWGVWRLLRQIGPQYRFDVIEAASAHFPGLFNAYLPPYHVAGGAQKIPQVTRLYTTYNDIFTAHGEKYGSVTRALVELEAREVRRAPIAIANSAAHADSYAHYHKVTRDKIRVIHLAAPNLEYYETHEPPTYPHDPNRLYFLFAGRMELKKGPLEMLLAFNNIAQLAEFQQAELHYVGQDSIIKDGLTTQQYAQTHLSENVRKRIFFHGEVSTQELHGHYGQCDIYVSPTYFESFGLVVLEAMIFGRPVVASRVGGVPEIAKEGETALLVAHKNVEELTTALLELARDPVRREQMGQAGRKRALAEFSHQQMLEKSLQTYHDAISYVNYK